MIRPGRAFPLGATPTTEGTNFAVASDVADAMILCLFENDGTEHRIPMLDYDAGVWHALVPGAGPGLRYGFRATGPWDLAAASAASRPSSCSIRMRTRSTAT